VTADDVANLLSFCDQQQAEAQRIAGLMEASVEELRTAVAALSKGHGTA